MSTGRYKRYPSLPDSKPVTEIIRKIAKLKAPYLCGIEQSSVDAAALSLTDGIPSEFELQYIEEGSYVDPLLNKKERLNPKEANSSKHDWTGLQARFALGGAFLNELEACLRQEFDPKEEGGVSVTKKRSGVIVSAAGHNYAKIAFHDGVATVSAIYQPGLSDRSLLSNFCRAANALSGSYAGTIPEEVR